MQAQCQNACHRLISPERPIERTGEPAPFINQEGSAMTIEIGYQVKISAASLQEHGQTGTIVDVHRNADGAPVNTKVQIDGTAECRWLAPISLQPIRELRHA